MKVCSQKLENKLGIYLWDNTDLKNLFQRTSLQIFQINELKLVDVQSELNSFKGGEQKSKEIMVKIYSIFENMQPIFKRLGIQELYQQIKLVVNSIGKLVLSNEGKTIQASPKSKQAQKEFAVQIFPEILSPSKANQPKGEKRSQKALKMNQLGGISLYNESYLRNLDRSSDMTRLKIKFDIQNMDYLSKTEEIERQEMILHIQRKKQLSILRINDHSKKYQEIQDDFSFVEERVKILVDNLEQQFQVEKLKSFQFMSKEEITTQILSFNQNMKGHLIDLKDQYSSAAQHLRLQNQEMKNKLQEQLERKSTMVNREVQTTETIASIKKVKKLTQQYQAKVQKLQASLSSALKKQIDWQERFEKYVSTKEKQIMDLTDNVSYKEKQLIQFRKKCNEYEQTIKKRQSNLISAISSLDSMKKQYLISQLLRRADKQGISQEAFQIKKRIHLLNRKQLKYSLHSLPRHSIDGELSQLDRLSDIFGESQITFENVEGQDQEDSQSSFRDEIAQDSQQSQNFEPQKQFKQFKKPVRQRQSINYYPTAFQRKSILQVPKRISNKSHGQLMKLQNQSKFNIINSSVPETALKKQIELSSNSNTIVSQPDLSIKNRKAAPHRQSVTTLKSSEKNRKDAEIKSKEKENPYYTKITHHEKQNRNSQIKLPKEIAVGKNSISIVRSRKLSKTREVENIQNNQSQIQNRPTSRHQSGNFKYKQQFSVGSLHVKRKSTAQQSTPKISQNVPILPQRNSCLPIKSVPKQHIRQLSQYHAFQSRHDTKNFIKQVAKHQEFTSASIEKFEKQYPQIIRLARQCQNSRKFYHQIHKIHRLECREKSCNHLQAFINFYIKYKEAMNKREAIKLPIQNFLSV